MTIYYVSDTTGNDANAGTSLASPKKTIANACGVADNDSGNIVEIIDSATYEEGDIAIFTNPIKVRATGSNKPVMDGDPNNNDYAFTSNCSGNVFQGLTMRNYDDGIMGTFGWPVNSYAFMLSGCICHFIEGPQQIGAGGMAEVQRSLVVSDTRNAFTVYENQHVWFNNSVLASNADGYPVIDSTQAMVNVTASFCTFLGDGYTTAGGARSWNLLNQVSKVINCIVSGTGDGINADSSTYNLVHVSGDPFITWSAADYDGTPRSANTGEITGNPLFVTGGVPGEIIFTSQNYDLQVGSPAIGAGVAFAGVSIDQSGTVRVDPPSIGAYEGPGAQWSDYYDTGNRRYTSAFVDRRFEKIRGDYKYKSTLDNRQAPFSLNVRGVPSLRNRQSAYSSSI